MRKIIIPVIFLTMGLLFSYFYVTARFNLERVLPAPELSEGLRGKYGIDKNINETTIDKYLNRSDTVYRDVRMLVDTATWENKGGDRYLSGYIKGFEVIPSPFLANYTDEYIEQKKIENISGLYSGPTLFKLDNEGNYTPNYQESMSILESIFPKDKNIFIICGAGGYAGQVKHMLVKLGWNEDLVRDIGGFWYYEGKNAISVKETIDGKEYYNFSKVPYYNLDFDSLTEIK